MQKWIFCLVMLVAFSIGTASAAQLQLTPQAASKQTTEQITYNIQLNTEGTEIKGLHFLVNYPSILTTSTFTHTPPSNWPAMFDISSDHGTYLDFTMAKGTAAAFSSMTPTSLGTVTFDIADNANPAEYSVNFSEISLRDVSNVPVSSIITQNATLTITSAGPCTPSCAANNACGGNGCGGSCGTCPSGQTCSSNGVCEACTPNTYDTNGFYCDNQKLVIDPNHHTIYSTDASKYTGTNPACPYKGAATSSLGFGYYCGYYSCAQPFLADLTSRKSAGEKVSIASPVSNSAYYASNPPPATANRQIGNSSCYCSPAYLAELSQAIPAKWVCKPDPNAPTITANAGPDQTVAINAPFVLNASKSSSSAGAMAYSWSAPAGITLSATDSQAVTANASAVGTYTITLTVYSASGTLTATDTAVIAVTEGKPKAVLEVSDAKIGDITVFSADKSSDPGGQIVSYEWYFDDHTTAPWGVLEMVSGQVACVRSSTDSCILTPTYTNFNNALVDGAIGLAALKNPCVCLNKGSYIYPESSATTAQPQIFHTYAADTACTDYGKADHACGISLKVKDNDGNADIATRTLYLITQESGCTAEGKFWYNNSCHDVSYEQQQCESQNMSWSGTACVSPEAPASNDTAPEPPVVPYTEPEPEPGEGEIGGGGLGGGENQLPPEGGAIPTGKSNTLLIIIIIVVVLLVVGAGIGIFFYLRSKGGGGEVASGGGFTEYYPPAGPPATPPAGGGGGPVYPT